MSKLRREEEAVEILKKDIASYMYMTGELSEDFITSTYLSTHIKESVVQKNALPQHESNESLRITKHSLP